MRTKTFLLVLVGTLITIAAWAVRSPAPAQSGEVPEKYRDTLAKGLGYLVKHQAKDGRWEGHEGKHPVAVTALAGIALLMEGSNLQKGKYSANLRKATDWLTEQSQPGREGLIFSGHASENDRYMQGHGLATLFLAWSIRNETDPARQKKLMHVLDRSAKYIVKAQSTQGGWHNTSKLEGHDFEAVVPTAIQIQALYMVSKLGIPIRSETVTSAAQEYVKTTIGKIDDKNKPKRPLELAAALASRASPDAFLDQDGVIPTWAIHCRNSIPLGRDIQFGRDELTHYFYAQALFALSQNRELDARGESAAWIEYRKLMFDHLQSSQNKDGSWPAPVESKDGLSAGAVYSAAVWCTVLQFDKLQHPLTRQRLRVHF